MCGILGVLPVISETVFRSSLDRLSHRGPDGSKIMKIDNDVLLGHTRLSILDTSQAATQPMQDASRRYTITFNGEIYNFLEIKKELEDKGYRHYTSSDTEVLLNAYICWGEKCLLRFNGMWSLAIWDREDKSLFISRDRFGKKPLFYVIEKNKFIFGSEMKAVAPLMSQIQASPKISWMKENLFLYEASEHCLVDGMKRFPAAHYGIWKDGHLSLHRYWNTLDHLVKVPDHYQDQLEAFEAIFMDAVKLRMRSDVSIGTALSGGVDSSCVFSAMAHIVQKNRATERVSQDWQHAFVAIFPGHEIDEQQYAKKVVDHLGVKATYIEIDPLKSWDQMMDYLYFTEDLYLTTPIPMIETYGAVKKHGVTVTLDGHGADELFSGYDVSLYESFESLGFNLKGVSEVFDTFDEVFGKQEGLKKGSFKKHLKRADIYTQFLLKRKVKNFLKIGYFSKDFNHPEFQRLDSYNKHLYILFHETILPTLLRNYDRYSMTKSVEVRMPFLDHRLVSFSFSLPWQSKLKNGYTKSIIRDSMKEYVPHEILYRKTKVGFSSPMATWLQGPLKQYIFDTIHSLSFQNSSVIDSKKIKNNIEQYYLKNTSSWSDAQAVWTDLTPYLWEQAFLKKLNSQI